MKPKLVKVRNSTAWDGNHNLPLIPQHNNPWIYSAYIMKCIQDEMILGAGIYERLYTHLKKCMVEPGLFNRWPNGSGGVTSHDEIMGIAWHFPEAAKQILKYLMKNDGIYLNKEVNNPERYNVYRMIFLKPFLLACAKYQVSVLSQIKWSVFLVYDLLTHRKKKDLDCGGRLRIWIMLDRMESLPICKMTIWIWRRIMHSKGLGPKFCFNYYLAEVPVMKDIAPDRF